MNLCDAGDHPVPQQLRRMAPADHWEKITVCLMATVVIALLLVGGVSIVLNYRSTISTVDQMLNETAVLAAEHIDQELTACKNVVVDTGCVPQLSGPDITAEEKHAIADTTLKAARAGSAGKGFAVVADEVRNLAAKSDTAAKATKELIEGSIVSVSDGARVVNQVTESLERTAASAANVSTQMDVVREAVENQTTSIAQVTEGIDQISAVVQIAVQDIISENEGQTVIAVRPFPSPPRRPWAVSGCGKPNGWMPVVKN